MSKLSYDAETAQRFIDEIEKCKAEKLSRHSAYMAECAGISGRIKDWKDRAVEAGIARKPLNAELKRRDLQGKIDGLTDDFEADELEELEDLQEALGVFVDTPLGRAAMGKAEGDEPAPKGKGRKKAKAGEQVDTSADAKAAALESIDDDLPDADDPPPRFLKQEEAERVAENVERLEAGIHPLN